MLDVDRWTTTTRYHWARRLGGNPADMGWESQAVHLVSAGELGAWHSTELTMWIFMSDAMLSIVQKSEDKERGSLTVRARGPGEIESVFPEAQVIELRNCDYRFRAVIARETVAKTVFSRLMTLEYDNFKNSIKDEDLESACHDVWSIMFQYQKDKHQRAQD